MQKIGSMKYKLMLLEFEIMKLKRKVSLIQADTNNGHKSDEKEIEKLLERELSKWLAEIEAYREKVAVSQVVVVEILSADDSLRLRTSFRKIAKTLHPDFNSDLSEKDKNLWQRAVDAYKQGDLNALVAIELIIEENGFDIVPVSGIPELTARKQKLVSIIADYYARISKLRSEFPLNIKEQLHDEAWVAAEHGIMHEQITRLNAEKRFFEDTVSDLLRGINDVGRANTH